MSSKMVFHHIGIAAENMDEMIGFMKNRFYVENIDKPVYDENQDADVCMITLDDGTNIELIAGAQVKDMVRKCRYLYHTCYVTDNMEETMQELIADGYKIVREPAAAVLFGGSRVAFMSGNLGIIELLEEGPLTYRLVEHIGIQNPMQRKYLKQLLSEYLLPEEKKELEKVIAFLMEDSSVNELADAYLLFVEDTFKETKYFIDHDRYRYSSFYEVNEKVYSNDTYMSQYLKGLQLSGYIWKNHLKVHRYFLDRLHAFTGDLYLEIGPGHGQYFMDAINEGRFRKYTAIDLSQSSINLTETYIRRFRKNADTEYELICDDFITHEFQEKFDCVCISEVLEHVENPEDMLRKIHEITNPGANIYISVPVNAPTIDHIYLYRSVDEVRRMTEKAGFRIDDSLYVTENDIPYEKAVKKKRTINCVLCAARQEEAK